MTLRSFADGALFAEVTGSGAPVTVALHGWGRDRHDWDPVTARLHGQVVTFDLPGHGASPPPPEPWGAAEFATAVAAALDELAVQTARPAETGDGPQDSPVHPAVVLGHSRGGGVAVCLAAMRPELVSGLVLAGAPLLRRQSTSKAPLAFRVGRALHRKGLVSDRRMEALRQRYGSADYLAAQGVMRDVLVRVVNESYEEQLASLRCPVSLVWGDGDTAVPPDVARRACDLLTDCTLDVAEGVGHDVHLERPELLVARAERLAVGA